MRVLSKSVKSVAELYATFRRGFSSRRAMIVCSSVMVVASMSAAVCNPEKATEATQGDVITALIPEGTYDSFVGDSLTAKVRAFNGQNISGSLPYGKQVTGLVFKWTSSNPNIAQVIPDNAATTEEPNLALKAVGTATLTATVNDSRATMSAGVQDATIIVRVGEAATGVRLTPHGGTVREGQTLEMRLSPNTASGNATFVHGILGFICLDPSIGTDVIHTSAPDPQVCGSTDGTLIDVKGLKVGTARIVGAFVYGIGLGKHFRDTAVVTVLPAISPTRVEVSPTSARLLAGNTKQLSATVYDQSNNVITGSSVTWLTGNSAVGTVSGQGLAKGEGTNGADSAKVQITARAAEGVEAATTITVYRAVSTVVVSPNPKTLQVGSTHPFTYQLKATNNSDIPLDLTTVTWSTGSNSIATVNQAGVVTAVSPGTTTVTARTAENISGSANITVEAIPVSPVVTVVVSPASVTLQLSVLRCQFTARGYDANGNEVTGLTFRWLIDDSNLATVDGNGLVTFNTHNNEGTTKVRAFLGNAADAPNGFGTLTLQ